MSKFTTQKQREFEARGFCTLYNAISSNHLKRLISASRRLCLSNSDMKSNGFLHTFDFINTDSSFAEMAAQEDVLTSALTLLGWNIYVYHAHLDVNAPIRADATPPLAWHRDNARINSDLENVPRLSIKAAFWLSNVSVAGRGNMYVIPGSHLWSSTKRPSGDFPTGSVPVLAHPGDVTIFDSRLWHARSANRSRQTRRAAFYAYAYRWLRPRDDAPAIRPTSFKLTELQAYLLDRDIGIEGYDPSQTWSPLRELYELEFGRTK